MKQRGLRPRTKRHFDLTRLRLRELERIIERRGDRLDTDDSDLYLLPVAQCLLKIRQKKFGVVVRTELVEALQFWAEERAATLSDELVGSVVDRALEYPAPEKADRLALRIRLTYDERLALAIRTIGACDADRAERARRAKERKRKRQRERIAAKRLAAGARPRERWLADSLARIQPWLTEGISKRTWYRRRRERAGGTGPLPEVGTGPSPLGGKGESPHKSSTGEPGTSANTSAAPARGSGTPRAPKRHAVPRAPAVEGKKRLASAPSQAAEASEPPRHEHSAEGRHVLLLQKWGTPPADALELFGSLVRSAGAARRGHVDELFAMMERRHSLAARGKIEWLRRQVDLMAARSEYRAVSHAPSLARRRRRENVLMVLRFAPGNTASVAEIADGTGESVGGVRHLVAWLLKDSEIVRVRPGVFTLPQAAVATYEPSRDLILKALDAAPQVTTPELVGLTGKSRTAFYSELARLEKLGAVVRVKRGVYARALERRAG